MKQSELAVLWRTGFQFLHGRLIVCALALPVFVASGCATTQDKGLIITAEQFDQVAAAGPDDDPQMRGGVERGAPTIIIENPERDTEVTTPFQVQMRFVTTDGAKVDLDTLKIKYRWFDLTDEVLKRMTVSVLGIKGQIDAVKPGKYKLKFSISDENKRTGRAMMTFHVVD